MWMYVLTALGKSRLSFTNCFVSTSAISSSRPIAWVDRTQMSGDDRGLKQVRLPSIQPSLAGAVQYPGAWAAHNLQNLTASAPEPN